MKDISKDYAALKALAVTKNPYDKVCPNRHLWEEGFISGALSEMSLYVFLPNETGYRIYYVMSLSFEEATKSVIELDEKLDDGEMQCFSKSTRKYSVEALKQNEVSYNTAD